MSKNVRFVIPDRLTNTPVRLSIILERKLYEEAEQVADILRKGTIQNLITFLLEQIVEELKAEGFDVKPSWEVGRK
jgi:hypothetical protein